MPATATRQRRTDAHRPAEFDPADYHVIDYIDNKRPEPPLPGPRGISADAYAAYDAAVAVWQQRIFEHFPDWRTDGGDHQSIHQCNHCGHPGIRWVAVVEHAPTGGRLAFGEICADRCDIPGRDAFRSKFIKDRAALEQAAYENRMRRAAFADANADVAEFLDGLSDDYDSREPGFLLDMKRTLGRKGELSEAQAAATRKFMASRAARQERFAAETASLADAQPLEEGRRVIEGEIVSVKSGENDYGAWTKMLIRQDDGNKVYGTVPASIFESLGDWYMSRPSIPGPDARVRWEDDHGCMVEGDGVDSLRGRRVRLTAKVERSRDDQHFGFYSRPTGATLVGQEGTA